MNELDNLIRDLKAYVNKNYCCWNNPNIFNPENSIEQDIVKGDEFTSTDVKNIEDLLAELGETFQEMLFRKIKEAGVSESEIYKRADIDRKLFSKIRRNPVYHASKDTVIALALALKLNLSDAVEMLEKAGYALSSGNARDLIIKYFIEQEIYDCHVVNYALYEFGQPTLRGRI